jgi:hypothetical protein
MCYERLRRREERAQETRRGGLWDLFYRETERPAPSHPVAERQEARREPKREEALTGAARPANDWH